MLPLRHRVFERLTGVLIALALFICSQGKISAAEGNLLSWNKKEQRMDANIAGLTMEKLLSRLKAATGWNIFVQPDLEQDVTVKFKKLPAGEGLRLLLGNYNYALIPQTNGPAKLFIYQASIAKATKAVENQRPKNWIANEIVVSIAPNSKEDIDAIAKQTGAKVVGKAEDLGMYRLRYPDAEAAEKARDALANNNNVRADDNYEWNKPEVMGGQTAAQALDFPLKAKDNPAGNYIKVAMIDTPIQSLDGKMNDFMLPEVHLAGDPQVDPSKPSHATSMAQAILSSMAGITKSDETSSVRLQVWDVYGSSPTTTTFDVTRGIYNALKTKPDVINLPLGGAGDAPYLEETLAAARKQNVLIFAAAGNEPTTEPVYPAASPNAIAVTAADWRGDIASYANRGDFVEVKAPGSMRTQYNGQIYLSTGTSTATSFISGQAAALRAKGLDPNQTAAVILQSFNAQAPPVK